MTTFLLDTNHLTRAVESGAPLREKILTRRRGGDRFGTGVPVLCELEIGIQQARDPEDYRRRVHRFLDPLFLWPLSQDIAQCYGRLFIDLRRRGRILSQVDLMLAAMAMHLDLTLLTADRDFEAIPNLQTENWLAPA